MKAKAPKPAYVAPEFLLDRTSLQWPKHWQLMIYKIEKNAKIDGYVVLPRNPDPAPTIDGDFLTCIDSVDSVLAYKPYLDPVEFSSLDDVDNWARMACRLEE